MRRAELLLKQVQRATENERAGVTDGISLEEYYQYFTDGLRRIQRAILEANNKVFRTSTTFLASGAEKYDLPADIFASNRVATLEYSSSGQEQDYVRLEKRTQIERASSTGCPTQYVLEGKSFYVNAYPKLGKFRLTYNQLLPALDKRRATVSSFTDSGTKLTALTIAGFDSDELALFDYLCVVGFDGTVKMRGVPFTEINDTTGVVSIYGNAYTYPDGSDIAAGDYVTFGEYASTHFLIDDQAEDFLVTYCQKRILMRDSSADVEDLAPELMEMLAGIVEVYADDPDITEVPISNYDYWTDID